MNKKPIIFIEGQDRTGKDNLVKNLVRFFFSKTPVPIHCVGTKAKGMNGFYQSYNYYFKIMNLICESNNFFILNRSHIGEYVYSPIYRDYSGEYIFSLEEKFSLDKLNTYLIYLKDSSNERLQRDDQDSLSNSLDLSNKESASFEEAIDRSIIKNKLIIDIKDKTIEEVHKEVLTFISILVK